MTMEIRIDTDSKRVMRIMPNGTTKMVGRVKVLDIAMINGQVIQVNEYEDGSWDIWQIDPKRPETPSERSCFALAASFHQPDKHFNE